MGEVLYLLLAGTLAAGVGQRTFQWWRERDNAQLGMMLLSNATGALGLAAFLPPIASWIERSSGVTDLGGTIFRCLLMVCFVTAQITFLLVVYPAPRAWADARPRIAGYALALVAMAGLFVLVRTGDPGTRLTLRDGARDPAVATHLLLFYGGWAVDVIEIGRLGRRYSRIADEPWLRRGLSVLAVGCWIGLAYPLHQAGLMLAYHSGAEPGGDQTLIAVALITACVVPVFAGLALPSLGPGLGAGDRWISRYARYRRLYPLWLALYRGAPHIALEGPKRVDALTVRDLGFRLYRRVIEIRDGMLALRDLTPPGVSGTAERLGRAAGLAGADLEAHVEAARIAAALAEAARRPPRTGAPSEDGTSPHAPEPRPTAAGADLAEEVEWLARITPAYRRRRPGPSGRIGLSGRRPTSARRAARPGRPADR